MDVHQDSMAVAYVVQDHGAEVTSLGTVGTRQYDIDNLVRKIQSKAKHLVFVYEAGPCGSWLYRYLTKKAITAAWWRRLCFRKSQATVSKLTAVTPRHWPA
jgi:hypothetical protein